MSGVRKIICSTTPNSQMGRNALKLVNRTLSAPHISVDKWYGLLFITKCAIENSSPSDNIDADDLVPSVLGDLYEHAQSLDKSSASHAKARSNSTPIGSLSAGGNFGDNINWTHIYGESNNGRLQRLVPRSVELTFCMRLPITKKNKFFTSSVSRMPGMYMFESHEGSFEVAPDEQQQLSLL